ncbi:syncytin-2 [Oreochromis niloticus]|uniref:syncytin-2 n=1 Tax=Oreochromis niloticus TaxID=8128 RepID=UPI000393DA03|nr:syncytin-2 [Oreochromis niloticus]CAI5657760.1 unnamed protein product [Mustela putorius furo]
MKKLFLATLALAVLVTACFLLLRPDPTPHQKRAWMHDNSHLDKMTQDHNHPWMNNAWYRYVYNRTTERSCYICSHMPVTSVHASIFGKTPNPSQSMCIMFKALTGNCSDRGMVLLKAVTASQMSYNLPACVNQTTENAHRRRSDCIQNFTTTNFTCDEENWVNIDVSNKRVMTFPVFLKGEESHPICFNFSHGSKKLGKTRNCSTVFNMSTSGTVQFENGTFWVQGAAWVCGPKTYFMLPPNSTGMCAPILISDHTFKVTATTKDSRRNRDVIDVQPHDAVWGSDVPEEFKHWSTGTKVLLALFPWVGTAKNTLRLETLDYRFGFFLNASCKIKKAQNEEIDALRISVMQHRVALDMLLVEKGGLCVLFNTTCCTYIPDDVHSSNMTDALQLLKNVQQAQVADWTASKPDWLGWLMSGSWKALLIKGLIFVGILLLLFCIFTTYIIPCIRGMISRMINHSIAAYVNVTPEDEDDDTDDKSVDKY